jgi:6-pyruvoyltetrahydropterin/6-carboxytetrahydropterin synthase
MQIRKRFTFEAAHFLPYHPGKCSRLHGHSYALEIALEGPLHTTGASRGMVEDFDALATTVKREIVAQLDHASLNDFLENPTAEEIARWIWQRLSPQLAQLCEIVLWETATACVVLRAGDAALPALER